LLSIVTGTLSALGAAALVWLINAATNLAFYGRFSGAAAAPAGNHLGLAVILIPMAGALIIGLMARYGSEKIRGHGIPEAIEAILIGKSKIQPRVALLKPISSAISIGTGGPFGAEGPIIMTGGALGSLFAQLFHLSPAERKTLLVSGAAAGMSAIFASPVAAVLLAVELLLFEWRPRSFIPVSIAASVAAAMRVPLLGAGPIFPVVPHPFLGGEALLAAFIVGILCGLGSGLLTTLVYAFEDLFQRLPIHWMWWPVLGAVFVGIGGWLDPRILGVGYETIHGLLRGEIVGVALIGILLGKSLVWSIALGSGTSGGVLAPLLMMGGALGALAAPWIPAGDAGLWATVGMAAMMGGTMRSPLTAMVFALELTRDLGLLPALLVGCVAAYGVTVLLMRRSILTEKVARRGHHISREYAVDPLHFVRVREVMDPVAPTIDAELTVGDVAAGIARHDSRFARHEGMLVIDRTGQLAGVLTRGDVLRALDRNVDNGASVLEAATRDPITTYPDDLVQDAVAKMLRHDVGRLPVVSREDPKRPLGYLGRAEAMAARRRMLHEEHAHEPGWIAKHL
jgi:H+/Cl- antiporter ClcA/CBS domain-containing protein